MNPPSRYLAFTFFASMATSCLGCIPIIDNWPIEAGEIAIESIRPSSASTTEFNAGGEGEKVILDGDSLRFSSTFHTKKTELYLTLTTHWGNIPEIDWARVSFYDLDNKELRVLSREPHKSPPPEDAQFKTVACAFKLDADRITCVRILLPLTYNEQAYDVSLTNCRPDA